MTVSEQIEELGIVPVVVIENVEDAVPLAEALLAGGVNFAEVTFRTACAADAIKSIKENVPSMHVGAGTILNKEQAMKAVTSGAEFIVSPGFDGETVKWCLENDIYVCPGCVTPSEIMQAIALGLKVVKFFPADVYGGLKAMKALSGPFGGIKFLPTGGVNKDNLDEYAGAGFIAAVGGSWLCKKDDIKAHNFAKITELCSEAVKVIKEVRG